MNGVGRTAFGGFSWEREGVELADIGKNGIEFFRELLKLRLRHLNTRERSKLLDLVSRCHGATIAKTPRQSAQGLSKHTSVDQFRGQYSGAMDQSFDWPRLRTIRRGPRATH